MFPFAPVLTEVRLSQPPRSPASPVNESAPSSGGNRSPVVTGILIALSIMGILLAGWLIVKLKALVVLLLISVVLASGIDPVVQWIHRQRLPPKGWQVPRALAILLVLLGALLVFVGIVVFIGSVAWSQGLLLWERLPLYTAAVQDWFADLRAQYPQIPPITDLGEQARRQLGQMGSYAFQTIAAVFGVLGGLVSTLTVMVLTFYILHEKEGIGQSFMTLISPQQHDRVKVAFSEAGNRMGGWLRGQLVLAGIVTAIVSVGMWALGIPYPLLLGLIGGIAELIPMLGPFAAGAIAIPIAFISHPTWVGVATLVFFVVLSQVEGNWLAPRIMQSSVGLSPLTSILALLSGAALLGVVGALLSVPLAAGLKSIIVRLVVPALNRRNLVGPE